MSRNTVAEKKLLLKLRTKQDPEAFAELYDLYVKRIYSFVFFKVSSREEAEDITSEIFLKAWRYINEKKEIESFSGLLYRLARNGVIDLYRAKSKQKESLSVDSEMGVEVVDAQTWKANLSEDLENKLEMQKIISALQKMKEEYKEIVTLRYVDELEISEIAEITGKGQIAIRVILHRGLKKLKEIMTQQ
ncbi:MAG TPA: RNA polymerase sigma factor [Candidatus Udaeobacter sp.]|nr:RNA polymerase sigma factor [Candidatus Udaeobacter sp.]